MNNCILGDCMEYMATLPDNAFDLSIVDPPYGIGDFWKGGDTSAQHSISALRGTELSWNDSVPTMGYWYELARVSKNFIAWGWNYYTAELGPSDSLIVWWKNLGAPNYSQCEIAYTSFNHKVKYFRYDLARDNKNRTHPCQKPVALYKWLLQNYAKPGQTIFDSHVGSGSIRIACHDMGYDFTGCEIDADYHAAQEKRFQTHIAQAQLFEPAELTAQYHQEEL